MIAVGALPVSLISGLLLDHVTLAARSSDDGIAGAFFAIFAVVWVVLLAVSVASYVFGIWALVEILRYREDEFTALGKSRTTWLVLVIVGLLVCQPVGLVAGGLFLWKHRPELRAWREAHPAPAPGWYGAAPVYGAPPGNGAPQGYPPQGYQPAAGYPPQGYQPAAGYPPQGDQPGAGYPPQGSQMDPEHPPHGFAPQAAPPPAPPPAVQSSGGRAAEGDGLPAGADESQSGPTAPAASPPASAPSPWDSPRPEASEPRAGSPDEPGDPGR